MPPQTRSTQARLFNENDKFQILVSSDAIGMGLNLNIKRLVFHTVTKMTNLNVGFGLDLLSPSSVKQIGGRAGRMSSDYKIGML